MLYPLPPLYPGREDYMTLLSIKNKTEHAIRFNGLIKFMPGEVTVISEEDYKALPSIELLINRGDMELVGAQGERSKRATKVSDEVIEDA